MFRQFVTNRKWYQHFDFLEKYGIQGQMDCAEKWRRLRLPRDFKNKSVLDLGCNYGWYCFAAKQCGAGEVVGVDLSANNIMTAKLIHDRIYNGVFKVNFLVADIEKLHLDRKFDYILLLAILHRIGLTQPPHVAPIEKQLETLRKVCSWVDETLVLEYFPQENIHEDFLKGKFVKVEDLGLSISPDKHERRILKCQEPL